MKSRSSWIRTLNIYLLPIVVITCTLLTPDILDFVRIGKPSQITIHAPVDISIEKSPEEILKDSMEIVSNVRPILMHEGSTLNELPDTLTGLARLVFKEVLNKETEIIVSDEDYRKLLEDPSDEVLVYIEDESFVVSKDKLVPFSKAYEEIFSTLSIAFKDSLQKLRFLIVEYLKPNFSYNELLTWKNRVKALSSLNRIKRHISKGEVIVRRGEVVDEEDYQALEKASSSFFGRIHAVLTFITVLLWSMVIFITRNVYTWNATYSFIALILFAFLEHLIIKSGQTYILTPLVFITIVLFTLSTRNMVMNFITMASLLSGLYYFLSFESFLFNLILGTLAFIGLEIVNRRVHIVLLGGVLFLFALLITTVVSYIHAGKLVMEVSTVAWITASTLFASLLAYIALVLLENYTNITTKFSIYDYLNMEHPLLRMLKEKAVGTYNHSMNVALLAESAAYRVGADALLCKVGAYYHDIGKMENPEYFIENQHGYNPHDNLDPRESARIIISHVSKGVELARKYKLPGRIIDIIRTHHGTTLIYPFYKKAKEMGYEVDEKDFRYPGPKPRNNEEGIVMLADSVEAAVRSLHDRTDETVRSVIRSVIESKWNDGQLEHTDLRKADLEAISETFFEILKGIYHTRQPYD